MKILIVDDGSTDDSPAVLRGLTARYPELRPIVFEANAGQSAATLAGFRAARGDWVAILDADLQNPPVELARLWDTLPGHDAALGWRIRRVEIAVLVVMACGLLLLTGAAAPSTAHELPLLPAVIVLGLLTLAVLPLARVFRGAVPVLAGIAYAVVAVAARTVSGKPLLELVLHPLTWVMVIAAFVGQACLATALQRGSATSAVASMDATTVVISSVAGLALMGDRIAPGREWWVGLGVLLVVSGVLVLGRVSKPAPELVDAR